MEFKLRANFVMSKEVTVEAGDMMEAMEKAGAMLAEAYFDNKLKDASVNVQRRQKTFEAFARLPEEFTNEDVMRCFNLSSDSSARSKTSRLLRDHLIEKVREEKGTVKALFRKTGTILL